MSTKPVQRRSCEFTVAMRRPKFLNSKRQNIKNPIGSVDLIAKLLEFCLDDVVVQVCIAYMDDIFLNLVHRFSWNWTLQVYTMQNKLASYGTAL